MRTMGTTGGRHGSSLRQAVASWSAADAANRPAHTLVDEIKVNQFAGAWW